MNRKISFLRAGLTSAVGLVGIGVSGAVVLGLCLIPFPVLAGTPTAVTVNPTAAVATRICPGPLMSVQTRDGDATSFVPFEAPVTVYAATSEPVTESALTSTGDTQDGLLAPRALSVSPPADGTPSLIAGAQSQVVTLEDMSGLAVSACLEPEAESWLVGGATELGQSTLIRLANASLTDASVHIEVYGERGRVTPTGSNDVVVAAGTERVLSLAALAPDLAMPVVHVTSSGGSIVATLAQTLVRTIVPSGVDVIEPGSTANIEQIITGVRLVDMARFSDSEGGAVTSDEEPAVRVLATSADASDVVVTTIGPDGSTSQVKATLAPGVVLQLPFNPVPDGTYTVIVRGTTPIVAAVRSIVGAGVDPTIATTAAPTTPTTPTPTVTAGASAAPTVSPTASPAASAENLPVDGVAIGEVVPPGQSGDPTSFATGGDFTWYAASAPLGATTLVAVARAPVAELTLYNPLETTQTLVLRAEGLDDVSISVEPGRATSREIASGVVYRLEGDPGMRAGVTYSGVGLSSASSVRPPSRLGSAILVYPR